MPKCHSRAKSWNFLHGFFVGIIVLFRMKVHQTAHI